MQFPNRTLLNFNPEFPDKVLTVSGCGLAEIRNGVFLGVPVGNQTKTISWQGETSCKTLMFYADGRVIATQPNEQVLFLRTYIGLLLMN